MEDPNVEKSREPSVLIAKLSEESRTHYQYSEVIRPVVIKPPQISPTNSPRLGGGYDDFSDASPRTLVSLRRSCGSLGNASPRPCDMCRKPAFLKKCGSAIFSRSLCEGCMASSSSRERPPKR